MENLAIMGPMVNGLHRLDITGQMGSGYPQAPTRYSVAITDPMARGFLGLVDVGLRKARVAAIMGLMANGWLAPVAWGPTVSQDTMIRMVNGLHHLATKLVGQVAKEVVGEAKEVVEEAKAVVGEAREVVEEAKEVAGEAKAVAKEVVRVAKAVARVVNLMAILALTASGFPVQVEPAHPAQTRFLAAFTDLMASGFQDLADAALHQGLAEAITDLMGNGCQALVDWGLTVSPGM